ncbi:GNAT family N-acetyltransferase [Pradoshia sp. D12]|uniref:GNAT family N-acetyltransferase n=1 Tax=Bacillaceae TaxID=186817 RepID=UPI00080AF830|nr:MULTISPECIES: GNAT family N-acetyltransferase [Bacillaceae]OCA90180.1 acetyltransferase [Bacillus sp. FJAT-27986]QFK70415.1 GNAT family N-acetyltransferase [Pradoshia sp. D12]TPF72210.1 GNAT family N-acetyltransferase [Bacillus sp. D12]
MEIYQATLKNREGVSQLFNSYREFYHQPSDFDGAMTFISERLEKRDSIIFVAVNHKRYVGFIQLYPSFSSIAMKRTWILNDLYVIQEARREGIGQLLMDAAINLCTETGAKSLSLQTAPDNEQARRLYKNNGFTLDNEYDSFIRYFR